MTEVLIGLENSFTIDTYVKPPYILMLFVTDFPNKAKKKQGMEMDGKARWEGHRPMVPPTGVSTI